MADDSVRRRLHTAVLLVYVITQATAECHCLGGCNKMFQCTSRRGCQSGWSGPTCQSKNIALKKPTDQSSTVNDCQWAEGKKRRQAVCGLKTSDLAVDGKASSRYWSGKCIHTNPGQYPVWWYVDLQKTYLVNHMKIYFGNDDRRMIGFLVKVDNSVRYRHSSTHPPTSPVTVIFNKPVYGRKVRVELPDLKDSQYILNLCEVEVYGGYQCADGWYGIECGRRCFCRSPYDVCNKSSGHCPSGCPGGYKGTSCGEQCERGRYGFGCNDTCGRCKGGNVSCGHTDGKCKIGCLPNWDGEQCKDCKDNWFGLECDQKCNCMNKSEVCNKTTGQCVVSGCEIGWTGLDCHKQCEDGSYGANCSGTCGKCLGEMACNKINGSCTDCEERYSLPMCKECADGYYGSECKGRCGHCSRNITCDKKSGYCPEGCKPGWQWPRCLNNCSKGTYGENCSHPCGKCVGECNPVNGTCDQKGCMDGWTGHTCNRECADRKYGFNCSQQCGQCLLQGVCNKTTGHCPGEICDKGWMGSDCKEACNSTRTYGHNCNETCGWCLDDTCDPVTGHCREGCRPSYMGDDCRLKRSVSSNSMPDVGMSILYAMIAILAVVLLVAVYALWRNRHKSSDETAIAMSSLVIDNDSSRFDQDGAGPSETCKTEGSVDITYMNIVSTKVKVTELHQYITQRTDKFESEYARLPRGLQYPRTAAESLDNKGKNRFKAMYPYDHSRVILPITPGTNHSDYINASYIDSYSKKQVYIATQGPNPATVGDFWRMVWQEKSPIIVMLTKLAEGKKVKCEQYWPDENKTMIRGDITITNESCVQKADYVIRELSVNNTKLDQRHQVTQLHFVTWPDHGVPSAPALVRFWKVYQLMSVLSKKPFIIHCSAGVGRTGTFIALDVLMGRAREYGVLDVFDYVTRMREDRVSMVQTKEQYLFLHEVLLEALQSETTHMTLGTFETRFTTDTVSSPSEQSVLQVQWKNLQELHRVLYDTEIAGSLFPENVRKTRVKEILPADKYRPRLSLPVPETNDYINAVFVPSDSEERGLVVTQLPLPWTVVDFWRLVIDHNIRTVVTLEPNACGIQADDEAPFWPQETTEINCGPFVVSKMGTKSGQITSVSLQVWQKELAESTKHDVQLLYMNDWSQSQDTPTKTSDFMHLLNEVDILKKKNASGPIAIMCRDGATRCGLFCAAYDIIQRLKTDNDIDIYLTVRQLQAIRPSFLPSYAQYQFCYQMAKEFQKTVTVVYENFRA